MVSGRNPSGTASTLRLIVFFSTKETDQPNNYRNGGICIFSEKSHFRFWMWILLAIGLTGLAAGSFWDLQLDQYLYSPDNLYGRIFYVLAPFPALFGMTFSSMLFVYLEMNKTLYRRAGFSLLFAILCAGSVFYFCRGLWSEFHLPLWLCLIISLLVLPGLSLRILYQVRVQDSESLRPLAQYLLYVSLGTFACITLLKEIWNRPRYYALHDHPEIVFKNWFEPAFSSSRTLASGYGLKADAFKSFPSAHTATAAVSLAFPVFSFYLPKLKNRQDVIMVLALLFTILSAFSRLLLGMHFLSDVSAGFLIALFFVWTGK